MSLFVIADTHLSESAEKPMDVFGSRWSSWTEKLCRNWTETVKDGDTVVISGDISWSMTLEGAKADLALLNLLPGTKIIGKGNHDYWWSTLKKNEELFVSEGYSSLKLLFNNSYLVGNTVICGCRGWYNDGKNSPANTDYGKIVAREAGRLKLSLESAKVYGADKEKLVFFHFPPVFGEFICDEIINVLKEHGIKQCYYGHIHGKYDIEQTSEHEGIRFTLISADYLNFKPYKIN